MAGTRGIGSCVQALAAVSAPLLPALAAVAAWADVPSRVHDPVLVSAARLEALSAENTARLRMLRVADGRLVPMPYQFDPRDESGQVVVDAPRDFALDANDELVFMLKDAGARATPEMIPEGCSSALEIEVTSPDDGRRAWAYLVAYADPPPEEQTPPYVSYDLAAQSARSAHYQVDYARGRNFFTGVTVLPASSGSGTNLLRQSRMRGSPTFGFLFAEMTLDFTEQSSIVEIDGVRVGPVRAVRRAQLSVDLGSLFPELPSGIAYTYHYATSYSTPTRVRFPWIMLETLRDFRFENVLEFRAAATPLTYFDAGYPDGIELAPDARADLRTADDHEWWVHSGPDGTMLHALVIPEAWRSWGVVRGTVARSGLAEGGDDRDDDAGDAPAAVAAAGYTLLNMTSLREAGSYDLLMSSVVLPRRYQPGDEADAIAMLRAPLQVDVRPLAVGPARTAQRSDAAPATMSASAQTRSRSSQVLRRIATPTR